MDIAGAHLQNVQEEDAALYEHEPQAANQNANVDAVQGAANVNANIPAATNTPVTPPTPHIAPPIPSVVTAATNSPPVIPRVRTANTGTQVSEMKETLDTRFGNWTSWSCQMYYHFNLTNVRGYIEGTIAHPDENAYLKEANEWHDGDTYAMAMITAHLSADLVTHTNGCEDAQSMWESLKAMFDTTSLLVDTEQLRTIFENITTEGSDILAHLTRLKLVWDRMHLYSHNYRLMSDVLYKRVIAATLPRSWDQFTKPFVQGCVDEYAKGPTRNINSQHFIGLIKQEYEANVARTRKDKGERLTLENRISDANSQSKRNARGKRCCDHCGREGHWAHKCRFIGTPKCDICNKLGHESDKCWSKPGNKRPWKGKERDSNIGKLWLIL